MIKSPALETMVTIYQSAWHNVPKDFTIKYFLVSDGVYGFVYENCLSETLQYNTSSL
jgi:hypothetical protein